MKKIFSSAFSLLTSAVLLAGAAPLASFAEDGTTQFVDIDESETLSVAELGAQALTADGGARIASNYDYDNGAYNLGYYLDANNAEVYMQMMALINPSLDTVVVTLPEPLVIESSSWYFDINTDAATEAVFKACRSGIECASFDIPELYWLDVNQIQIGVKSVQQKRLGSRKYQYTVYQLTIAPAAYSGFTSWDELLSYKDKLEEAVANFEVKGNTRYEKIKSIHDTISKFTYYDLEGQFSGSCLGGLVVPGVVCEGYSKAFKLICDREGIPCVCIFGNYDPDEKTAHMWNYVQMEDGEWYGLDVTWDDYDGKYGYQTIYDFFLKGSDHFFSNHTEGEEYALAYFTYPTISKDDFDPTKPIVTTTTSTVTTTTTTTTTTITTAEPTTTTTEPTTAPPTTTTTTEPTTTTTTTMTTTAPPPTTTTTTATTVPVPEYEYGDVNHDGTVSVADLVCCADHALGKSPSKCYEDLTDDGRIDMFDVIVLRKLLTTTITATTDGIN